MQKSTFPVQRHCTGNVESSFRFNVTGLRFQCSATLAPHDLRRTCAKLCRKSGGDLEQIQMLLGHASIQTTERYLGSRQNLKEAVNDRLGLDE